MRATAPQVPMPPAPKLQAPLPQAPQVVPPLCQPLPSFGSQLATPYQQVVQLPSKPKGRGVTFDPSTNKVAAIGSQDADGHWRQRTHSRDDKTRLTSPGKGAHERSSIGTTGKQTQCQVSEHPSSAPREAPRGSTLGSTSHQHSSSTRAPKDPLRWVAHFRIQGWRKDLDLIFKAYYKYNFSSFKESEWSKIRDKGLRSHPVSPTWSPRGNRRPRQLAPVHPP